MTSTLSFFPNCTFLYGIFGFWVLLAYAVSIDSPVGSTFITVLQTLGRCNIM